MLVDGEIVVEIADPGIDPVSAAAERKQDRAELDLILQIQAGLDFLRRRILRHHAGRRNGLTVDRRVNVEEGGAALLEDAPAVLVTIVDTRDHRMGEESGVELRQNLIVDGQCIRGVETR